MSLKYLKEALADNDTDSLNPPSLQKHFELNKTLMHGASGLSRVQRDMIAVAVSAANHGHY